MGGPIKRVSSPGPPPVLGEGLGPAGRAIPSDSKALVPLQSGLASAEVSRQPFDPAFLCGKTLDGPGRILSRRDSSSIALPPGPSWRVENWGWARSNHLAHLHFSGSTWILCKNQE